jgi:O-Antigen ligase
MIDAQRDHPRAPRTRLASLGVGLVLLTLILIPILSGTNGLLLGFAAVVGAIGVVWVLQEPYRGVLILTTVLVLDFDPVGIRFLGIPYLLSALLLIPVVLATMRDRAIWVLGVPQVQILLIIGVFFLVSIAWNSFDRPVPVFLPSANDKMGTSRQMILFFSRLGLLIFFLYFITTRQRIETAAWLVVGLIIAIAMQALYSFVFGGANRARADFSLGENANRLAYICLFATSLLWFHRLHGQKLRRQNLLSPFFLLLPLTTITTGSRSGFLQSALLAAFMLKEHKGWSVAQRARTFFFLAVTVFVILAVVPTGKLDRVISFNPDVVAPGQDSLRNRIHTDIGAFMMAIDHPILGVGLGNFSWAKAFYGLGRGAPTHNAYLWALTAGGIGVLGLYLVLFFVTYRMLRQLERSGPPELLWLSKGLKVNLILFLVFSAFADFWLSDFLYLILGLTTSINYLWQRQRQRSSRPSSPLTVAWQRPSQNLPGFPPPLSA